MLELTKPTFEKILIKQQELKNITDFIETVSDETSVISREFLHSLWEANYQFTQLIKELEKKI